MNSEIREHLRQLDRTMAEAESLAAGLEEEALNWRAAPERWSVAQCLDHLNVTARKYIGSLGPAIEAARRDGILGEQPPRRGWLVRGFLWSLEPPGRFKLKAPRPFLPRDSVAPDDLMGEYRESHRELRGLIESADGIDLGEVKIASPVADWIKFGLGECFAVICTHERRHVWQARQVTQATGFPASRT